MNVLWFLIPCHGRPALTEVCLRQLKRTCEALAPDIQAMAAISADDENLETAEALGFATYRQDNKPLGRKWNDLYELACRVGKADFVVPLGSDDWVDPDFIAGYLPADNEVRCSRLSSVVSEDGQKLARLRIPYAIGDGVRIIPRALLKPLGFRPAVEHQPRAIDTSVMQQIERSGQRPRLVYHDLDALQIVDFKSDTQLNSYARCLDFKDGAEVEPWQTLVERYPDEAVEEMRAVYSSNPLEVAA